MKPSAGKSCVRGMSRPGAAHPVVLSGVFLALGVVFPLLFHSLGNAGPVFLPMHWPVFLGAVLLPPGWAAGVGLLTPLLSGALTGMPAFPFGVVLMVEMGVYGGLFALLVSRLVIPDGGRAGSWTGYAALLVPVMLSGRMLRVAVSALVFPYLMGVPFRLPEILGLIFLTGLPGMTIQLVVLPLVLQRLTHWKR